MMPPDVFTGMLTFVALFALRFAVPLLVILVLGALVRRLELALP